MKKHWKTILIVGIILILISISVYETKDYVSAFIINVVGLFLIFLAIKRKIKLVNFTKKGYTEKAKERKVITTKEDKKKSWFRRHWFLTGFLFIVALIVLGLIIEFYVAYQEASFKMNAKNLMGQLSPSDLELKNCEPSFGGGGYNPVLGIETSSWELRGIKDEKCLVYYKEVDQNSPAFNCYDNNQCGDMTVNYKSWTCKFPYEFYSNPNVDFFDFVLNSNYCKVV
jgi:hypothetical protein